MVETSGLEKLKTAIRYLAENSPNPFAGRKIATFSVFGICPIFWPFCAAYCYNSATFRGYLLNHTRSVAVVVGPDERDSVFHCESAA